jgi:hypothetical protein
MKAAPKKLRPTAGTGGRRDIARGAGGKQRPAAQPARRERPPRPARERGAAEKAATKTFSLHWGKGVIEEEVQVATPHHRPAIQLLRFDEGEAAGSYEVRFCHYDLAGRFQRAPLILGEQDLAALGRALARAPKLKRLLAKLLA